MTKPYKLYAAKGGGSMVVELAFAHAKVPVEIVDIDWKDVGWESKVLKNINPLGQVPTLILPDGSIVTESAAIVLHLSERVPQANLAPLANERARTIPTLARVFGLRRLSNVYLWRRSETLAGRG